MIRWLVSFKDVKGKEIEVEADDRWGAVVAAVAKLKLDTNVPMNYYAGSASVRKVERKKPESWWEKAAAKK